MTITARLLRTWSEHACRDTGSAAETAKALGFAGALVEHGDYWDVTPPPVGATRAMLVKSEDGIDYIDLELAAPLTRGELDACLGAGSLLPRVGPGRPHNVAYHVAVPGMPYTCEVIAAFTAQPTTPAVVAHGVVLRRDRA